MSISVIYPAMPISTLQLKTYYPVPTPTTMSGIQFDVSRLSAATISIQGRHFVDSHGRVLHLRGANVSAASKVPATPAPKIHDHAQASYVGRPFRLEEADEHWARLKSWGLTFVRITVTWEALEHKERGVYDEDYLAYLRALLQSMEPYGLVAYIALHQDVWSRYCGGSGAPGWTLEAAGFDLSNEGENLSLSGAAFLDGIKSGRLAGERGLWPTGYQKLAAATMNTLFWGGETFAPLLKVPGQIDGKWVSRNIQVYLQEAFLAATAKLVKAVGDLETVMGFELMNEPHPGFIGIQSIHEWDYTTDLHLGQFPSPLQSFSMGAGHPTPNVPVYTRSFPFPTRVTSHVTANPEGACAWASKECPWEKHGVWRWSEAKQEAAALQQDYFVKNRDGGKVDFYEDFYFPFVRKWEQVIGENISSTKGLKARMVEAIPNELCPEWKEESRPKNMVYAPHWYDLNTLFKKKFGFMSVNVQGLARGMFILRALYFGTAAAKANYALQIKTIVLAARLKLGPVPVIFGECGVPMDINNEEAFRTGDWKWQERSMDALISAMEGALMGFNLWTYNPANRDDIGDDWNAENFSWYSESNRTKLLKNAEKSSDGLDVGARLLNVIVRPYPIATAGNPTSLAYDANACAFTYRFRSPLRVSAAAPTPEEYTEIFLPRRVFRKESTEWTVTAGGKVHVDWERERVFVWFEDSSLTAASIKDDTRPRRIDIWVIGRKVEENWSIAQILVAVVILLLGVLVAYYAQLYEWEKDKMIFQHLREANGM
ncbi:cytoplasmic protein [Cryptococcus neoformans AD2-60a]|nr:cytoplasmic protein [Cryptococcus neoformans var. grubii AD2-60a]OWZ55916.1 cytoplasmic protein [Cryptococcus neoformans var. grubii AD1-83a]OXG68313.1 cytoplasmic protein [Cryptococcus neoformans var. grubii c8]OXG68875.1 cytoplasmic protein [Cryptococcus neoformans var. grubii MW-RSA1955]OXG72462.1 cytoplasmic protein [Cryptococcus neoformans var. grubii CHC193]OXG91996.1 cytoplasmic protein [Cryptococcus neoformans var. grubii Br795]OXH18418.1 cytoplasmic protein [Cryptococcus neoforman